MTSNEKMQRYIDLRKDIDKLNKEVSQLLRDVIDSESPFKKGDKIKYRRGEGQVIECSGYITEHKDGKIVFNCARVRAYKLKQDGTPSKVEIKLHVDYDKVEKV